MTAELIPVRSEFQVNTTVRGEQLEPTITLSGNSDFIAAFTTQAYSGLGGYRDIAARLINFIEPNDSSEFIVNGGGGDCRDPVNSCLLGNQDLSRAAELTNGNVVVTWASGRDFLDGVTRGQIIDKQGNMIGPEIALGGTGSLANYDVLALPDGGFLAAWGYWWGGSVSFDVVGQIFNADGTPRGARFLFSEPSTGWDSDVTEGRQTSTSLALLSDQTIIATWISNDEVVGRLFSVGGNALTEEFRIGGTSASAEFTIDATALTEIEFAAIWVTAQDSTGNKYVVARIFDENGSPTTEEIIIVQISANLDVAPSISATPDGGFVVAWDMESAESDGVDVYLQAFSKDGTPRTDPLRVNSYLPGNQTDPTVAVDGQHVAIAWVSSEQDGWGSGIYGRTFLLNSALSGPVLIDGVFEQAQVLSVNTSLMTDLDGFGNFTYQWFRNGQELPGESGATYQLSQDDVGYSISVEVSYVDGNGFPESGRSEPTENIANKNDHPIGDLTIFGVTENGQILSSDPTAISDQDGLGPLSYSWFRNGVAIAGETEESYRLTPLDVGASISARISYIDGFGTPESVTSQETELVALNPGLDLVGDEFDQKLLGSVVSEYIDGAGGNDTLIGGGGKDRLVGSQGNDFLDGDLFNVSQLPEIALQIYRLYVATLGREPDRPGHLAWVERLFDGSLTLAKAASGFVNSPEFQTTYGDLSNTEFVQLLYQNVLGREAEPSGLQAWVGQLEAGVSRARVVLGFSESPEFITNTTNDGERFVVNADPASWSDEVFRLYLTTLGRQPELGGFTNWIEDLAAGLPLSIVASAFVNSPEFQNTYGPLNDTEFVTLLYRNVLGRDPDPIGLQSWVSKLELGQPRWKIVLGFSESPELTAATSDALFNWMRGLGPDDRLEGGEGDDLLFGGEFWDEFVFDPASGNDTVGDLEPWDEMIVKGFGYTTVDDVKAHMTQQGEDVVFSEQGSTVTLLNIQLLEITDEMISVL